MNVRLDFAAPGARPGPFSWLLLVLGIAAAAAAAHAWQVAGAMAGDARARLAAASAVPAASKTPPAVADAARAQAEAEARRALARPWQRLLATLQDNLPDDIAVLGLEADGRQGQFQLNGVARHERAMLDYFRLLQTRPELRAVSLARHELAEIDGVQAVRFSLRGEWIAP